MIYPMLLEFCHNPQVLHALARLPNAHISSPQSTHSSPQYTHIVSPMHTVFCRSRERFGLEIGEKYEDMAVDSSAQAASNINGQQSHEDGTSPYHRGRGDSS